MLPRSDGVILFDPFSKFKGGNKCILLSHNRMDDNDAAHPSFLL